MINRLGTGGPTAGMRSHVIQTGHSPMLSLSTNMDARVLRWRDGDVLTLVHGGHHDAAYTRAEGVSNTAEVG